MEYHLESELGPGSGAGGYHGHRPGGLVDAGRAHHVGELHLLGGGLDDVFLHPWTAAHGFEPLCG